MFFTTALETKVVIGFFLSWVTTKHTCKNTLKGHVFFYNTLRKKLFLSWKCNVSLNIWYRWEDLKERNKFVSFIKTTHTNTQTIFWMLINNIQFLYLESRTSFHKDMYNDKFQIYYKGQKDFRWWWDWNLSLLVISLHTIL